MEGYSEDTAAGRDEVIDYTAAGPLTSLAGIPAAALSRIATEPVAVCFPVHGP